MKKLLGFLLCCAAIVGMAGCEIFNPIGPIISIGLSWLDGEASKYYHCEQTVINLAVHNVLSELQFPIREEWVDGDTIHIKADGVDRFHIKIEHIKDQITNLRIRVNIMGDKPYAELVFRNVDRQPGVKDFYSIQELKQVLHER